MLVRWVKEIKAKETKIVFFTLVGSIWDLNLYGEGGSSHVQMKHYQPRWTGRYGQHVVEIMNIMELTTLIGQLLKLIAVDQPIMIVKTNMAGLEERIYMAIRSFCHIPNKVVCWVARHNSSFYRVVISHRTTQMWRQWQTKSSTWCCRSTSFVSSVFWSSLKNSFKLTKKG